MLDSVSIFPAKRTVALVVEEPSCGGDVRHCGLARLAQLLRYLLGRVGVHSHILQRSKDL